MPDDLSGLTYEFEQQLSRLFERTHNTAKVLGVEQIVDLPEEPPLAHQGGRWCVKCLESDHAHGTVGGPGRLLAPVPVLCPYPLPKAIVIQRKKSR